MNHGPLIFLGVFAAFIASWWGMVFAPQTQIGSQVAKVPDGATSPYPSVRPGIAAQGQQVYVANGCVYCHSQQVRQESYTFDVAFTGTTNEAATVEVLKSIGLSPERTSEILRTASNQNAVPVKKNVSVKEAGNIRKALSDSGASALAIFIPTGADMGRGWGPRQSVATDYLAEYPVQIGNSRLGPDLADVGTRRPDAQWHLRHLYDPRTEVKGSIMPAYRYLFETRKAGRMHSPHALKLPPEFAPPAGYEVVPTEEALQLAAYLQSLRITTPLFEAPMTVLPQIPAGGGDTNAPAGTNAPAAPTNAPPQ